LPGKAIDYDLRIAEYEVMSRRRALTEHESLQLEKWLLLQAKQAVGKRYRAKNKEKIKAAHAKRMQADGEAIRQQRLEATQRYYARNKTKVNANTRRWYALNPEASRTRNASRTKPAGQLQCGRCGQQFTASVAVMAEAVRGVVKYCGKSCSMRAKVVTHNYDCRQCGKACVITRNAGGSPPCWCSTECRITHRSAEDKRKRLAARSAENGSSPPLPR
jgi:hypothetical protein